ncbi:MAG: hypothetical protein RIR33_2926 [Pseudomonadota bacterium]|jgi:uncharacterized protein YigE (DUF2233 family)
MGFLRASLALVFLVLLSAPRGVDAQPADAPCRSLTFEGDPFTVCAARQGDVTRLSLRRADGKPYRRLPVLKNDLGEAAGKVRFAMNAGMYDLRNAPIGLYVENGHQLRAINRRDGFGNFHLKPNGVFWVGHDGKAHVMATDAYVAQKPKPAWATQSGPMLVVGGKLHHTFAHDGPSRHIRNGVGVNAAGDALFVISDAPVSFGKLARLFRDELKVANALYFDGAVSSLWAPSLDRLDAGSDLGPLVVVTSP